VQQHLISFSVVSGSITTFRTTLYALNTLHLPLPGSRGVTNTGQQGQEIRI
jgi:hypothetical protein